MTAPLKIPVIDQDKTVFFTKLILIKAVELMLVLEDEIKSDTAELDVDELVNYIIQTASNIVDKAAKNDSKAH